MPSSRKTYGQFCALARVLDRIGERWTLLIVRELLVRPRRYLQLKAALPGIATNLLAQRLRDLEADGIVARDGDGTYALTSFGRGLAPAVRELISWGARFMDEAARGDVFQTQWLALALDALLARRRAGCIELRTGGEVMHIDRGRVRLGPCEQPRAVIESDPETILGVAAGRLPVKRLTITGDADLVRDALRQPA